MIENNFQWKDKLKAAKQSNNNMTFLILYTQMFLLANSLSVFVLTTHSYDSVW